MVKRFLFFASLLILLLYSKLSAQNTAKTNEQPADFVSYINIGGGIAGGELALSARVRPYLSTSFFLKAFWNHSLYNLDSNYLVGFKTKVYQNSTPNSFFAGPLLAVHGFTSGVRPLIGLTSGFDHYDRLVIFKDSTPLLFGVELQGGIDTEGDGFIGLGVNIGIGYLNTGEIRRDPHCPKHF